MLRERKPYCLLLPIIDGTSKGSTESVKNLRYLTKGTLNGYGISIERYWKYAVGWVAGIGKRYIDEFACTFLGASLL